MIARYYPYTLTLGSPLVLTSPGGDPNSVESMDFIPGSAVRGAAARVLTDASPDFHRLILSGHVSYLNAYLLLSGERSLPTPASLRREKYSLQHHDLAGYSGEPNDEEGELNWPSEQLTRLPSRYLTLNQPTPQGTNAKVSGCVHHQRDRWIGRPTEQTGALFRFDALDERQRFKGFVVCRGKDDATVERLAERVQSSLGGMILLGRSRRAGYGGMAQLEWDVPRPREVEGQRVATGSQPQGTVLRAVLVSDYLGRDATTGQTDPAVWVDELVYHFGGRVSVLSRFGDTNLVGGYNRKWGMELPQALAQRAGAVAVLQVTQTISEADLLAVEHQGLGDRRIEGFGRVVFLRDLGTKWLSEVKSLTQSWENLPSVEMPLLIREMERRLLRDAVDAGLQEAAGRIANSAQSIPTRSLLGRLRVPLRLPPTQALDQFRQWLGNRQNGLRPPARRQIDRCRIQATQSHWRSLAEWLQELLSSPSSLGDLLNYPRLAQDHHYESRGSALNYLTTPDENDRVRALLFDALFAAMARVRDQGSGGAS